MKRLALNNYGKGLQNLSTAKITDFKVKMKVAKIMKWFNSEVELTSEGQKAIEAKYELNNKFNEKNQWEGTSEEYLIYKNNVNNINKETFELLNLACEKVNEITLSEEELKDIDITAEDVTSLMFLDILV